MSVQIMIEHEGNVMLPEVKKGAKLTLSRKSTPGQFDFTVLRDDKLVFANGDPVKLTVDGTDMFYGFVFKKSNDRDGFIDVTAYDQLRYLKNKDTFVDEGLKASDLLQRLAKDFNLQTGEVEDTGYMIETIVEENTSLFDMIENAMDETLRNTGKLYVLYDNVGKLCLKNIESLKLDLFIDAETGGNFTYETSIDSDVYNKVKLAYDNDKTGKRELYVTKDSEKVNKWGVLQYFESIKTTKGAQAKADALLKLYDVEVQKLTIKDAFGDPRVKAGCSLLVKLDLGDAQVSQYLVVEKVTHNFEGDVHRMDMDMIGGGFSA